MSNPVDATIEEYLDDLSNFLPDFLHWLNERSKSCHIPDSLHWLRQQMEAAMSEILMTARIIKTIIQYSLVPRNRRPIDEARILVADDLRNKLWMRLNRINLLLQRIWEDQAEVLKEVIVMADSGRHKVELYLEIQERTKTIAEVRRNLKLLHHDFPELLNVTEENGILCYYWIGAMVVMMASAGLVSTLRR